MILIMAVKMFNCTLLHCFFHTSLMLVHKGQKNVLPYHTTILIMAIKKFFVLLLLLFIPYMSNVSEQGEINMQS
jgi:hypothetical protein